MEKFKTTRKKQDKPQGWFKRYFTYFELCCIYLSYQLTHQKSFSRTSSLIVSILERVQYIDIVVNLDESPVWTLGPFSLLKSAVGYVNLTKVLKTTNSVGLLSSLITITIIQFGFISLAVWFLLENITKKKFQPFEQIKDKKTAALMSYCNTYIPILFMPIIFAISTPFVCYSNSKYSSLGISEYGTCFNPPHTASFVLGILNILPVLLTTFFCLTFHRSLSPFLPYTQEESSVPFSTLTPLILKTLSLIKLYDDRILFYAYLPVLLFYSFRCVFTGDPLSWISCLALWCCLGRFFTQWDGSSEAFHLIGAFAVVWLGFSLTQRISRSLVGNEPKYSWQAIKIVFDITKSIEHRHNEDNRVRIQAFFELTQKRSPRYCKALQENSHLLSLSTDYTILDEKESSEQEKGFYTILSELLEDYSKMFPKDGSIKVLQCYILRQRMKNSYACFYLSHSLLMEEPTSFIKCEACKIEYAIEQDFAKDDYIFAEQNGMNVTQIFNFHTQLTEFRASLEHIAESYSIFWHELQAIHPSLFELYSYGKKTVNLMNKSTESYTKLNAMNPSNQKALSFSGIFKYNVLLQETEGTKLLELATENLKASQEAKNDSSGDMRYKYGENTDSIMICASGNLKDFGSIVSVSQEITTHLGYVKEDIVGNNVSNLIPWSLAEIHTSIMERYFRTSQNRFVNHERNIYPLKSDGSILPMSGLLRIMPNLSQGVQMVVFMKPSLNQYWQEHHLMIVDSKGRLVGVGASMDTSFGISTSCCYGRNSNFEPVILNSLLQEGSHIQLENMNEGDSVEVTIDTTRLRNRFFGQEIDQPLRVLPNLLESQRSRMEEKEESLRDNIEGMMDVVDNNENLRYSSHRLVIKLHDRQFLADGQREWLILAISVPKKIVSGNQIHLKPPTSSDIGGEGSKIASQNEFLFSKKIVSLGDDYERSPSNGLQESNQNIMDPKQLIKKHSNPHNFLKARIRIAMKKFSAIEIEEDISKDEDAILNPNERSLVSTSKDQQLDQKRAKERIHQQEVRDFRRMLLQRNTPKAVILIGSLRMT